MSGRKRDPVELQQFTIHFVQKVLMEELERLIERRPDLQDIDPGQIVIEPLIDQQEVFRVPKNRSPEHLQKVDESTVDHGYPFYFRFGEHVPRPLQFKKRRRKAFDDCDRRPSGSFRVVFPRQVAGPICLGMNSHYGMGLFLPG